MSEARRATPKWPAAVTAAWPEKLRDLPVSTKNGGSHTRKPTALADALDTITALPSDATKGDRKKALEARRLVEHLNATAPCVEGLWVVDLYCVRDATGLSFSSTRAALAKLQIDGWLDFEWTNPKRVGAEVWLSWVAVHSITTQNAHQWFTSALANRPKSALQTRVAENLAGTSSTSSSTSSSFSTTEPEPTDQPRPPEENSSSFLKSDDPPEQAAVEPEATAPPDNPAEALEEGTHGDVDRLVEALRCAQQRQGVDDSRWHGTHPKHAEAFLRSHSFHEGMLAVALREIEYRHPQRRQGECYLNALAAWRHFDTAKDRLIEQYGDGRWHDEGPGRIRWYGPTGDPWYVRPSADDVTTYAIAVDDTPWALETMAAGRVRMRQPDGTVVYCSEKRVWDLIIEGRIPCEGVTLGKPQWRDGYGWGGALIDGTTTPNPEHHYWKIEVAREDKRLPGWVRDAFVEAGKIDTQDERVPLPGPRLEQHNAWSAALDDRFKAQMKGDSDEIERTKARLAECSNPRAS